MELKRELKRAQERPQKKEFKRVLNRASILRRKEEDLYLCPVGACFQASSGNQNKGLLPVLYSRVFGTSSNTSTDIINT